MPQTVKCLPGESEFRVPGKDLKPWYDWMGALKGRREDRCILTLSIGELHVQ